MQVFNRDTDDTDDSDTNTDTDTDTDTDTAEGNSKRRGILGLGKRSAGTNEDKSNRRNEK